MNSIITELFPLVRKKHEITEEDADKFSDIMSLILESDNSEVLIQDIFKEGRTALAEDERLFLENIFRMAVNSTVITENKENWKISLCLINVNVIPKVKSFTPTLLNLDYSSNPIFKKYKLMNKNSKGFISPVLLSTDYVWNLGYSEVDKLFKGILQTEVDSSSGFLKKNNPQVNDSLFLPFILEEKIGASASLIEKFMEMDPLQQQLFLEELSKELSDGEKEIQVNSILPFYDMRALIKNSEFGIIFEENLIEIKSKNDKISRVIINREDSLIDVKYINRSGELVVSWEVEEASLSDCAEFMAYAIAFFQEAGFEISQQESEEIILKFIGDLH